jgi:integrase
MGIERHTHQSGYVQECGKAVKYWRGHYELAVLDDQGNPKKDASGRTLRTHKTVNLGPKRELKKWEAQAKLQAVIATAEAELRAARELLAQGQSKESTVQLPPPDKRTFEWFYQERYLPVKSSWGRHTEATIKAVFKHQILPAIGRVRIDQIDKVAVQGLLKKIAAEFSESTTLRARTYLKAVLEEAVDQEMLAKNPARKLDRLRTKKVDTRVYTLEEIGRMLAGLTGREHLVAHALVTLGLRPGELFGARRKDWQGRQLYIRQTFSHGRLQDGVKTEGSEGYVAVPEKLQAELLMWTLTNVGTPDDFIFKSGSKVNPLNPDNYLRRVFKAACEKVGVKDATLQAFRRSFATHFQGQGNVKDAQGQLRHSDVTTTLGIYTKTIPESQFAAVERVAEKFDQARASAEEALKQKRGLM